MGTISPSVFGRAPHGRRRATRRGHLAAVLAAGADTATGAAHWWAPGRPTLRIDAHAHALPPSYRQALRKANFKGPIGPMPSWSEAAALSFMRRYGIRAQVVSISDPGVEFVSGGHAVALAQAVNDELAALVQRYPDRFAALAVLPVRDVDASVAEVGRALDELRLDGVGLLSNYEGEYLGAARLDPLLSALDERAAYVLIHPTSPIEGDKPTTGIPDPILEFPMETTRAVRGLLRADAFRRFPRIRWQLSHAGGLVPALTDQLSRDLPDDPMPWLETLRYDTALSSSPWAMAGVRGVAGHERIVFGTDWPFSNLLFLFAGTPQAELRRSFVAHELRAVLSANVLADLPRLARAIATADG